MDQNWESVGWSKDNSHNRTANGKPAPKVANSQGAKQVRELDDATEAQKIEKVSLKMSKLIQQARQAKKWTQKDLAGKVQEKPQTINEYESGKAVPKGPVIQKLQRVLGVTLKQKK
eukprot:TRINITY_DN1872_c0_g1_i3.p3 TRINITY_DN1872_c0_g1~~TRINITY_DN1872_c0_g1_i3.p3  ORF type:complete len:116 (-),score=34.71 TRINITY_DN1872_c0_g1_i3:180-527(-)